MAIEVTASKTISAPISKVWATLTNHKGMADWAPGLKVTIDREGEGDPNGVGAVRRIASPGPMPTIVEEITDFEPETHMGYKALAGIPLKNWRGDVRLTAVGESTKIDYTVSADPRLPLLQAPVMRGIAGQLLGGLAKASLKS
jgi:uncharacterized protein YndB with AHSA1/START domain